MSAWGDSYSDEAARLDRENREYNRRVGQARCRVCGLEMHGCEADSCEAEHARRGERTREDWLRNLEAAR